MDRVQLAALLRAQVQLLQGSHEHLARMSWAQGRLLLLLLHLLRLAGLLRFELGGAATYHHDQ